jgi:hypothetical protein
MMGVHLNSVPTTVNRYLHYYFTGYVELRGIYLLILCQLEYQIVDF